jgi:EAL domain-containing protein (putative c-di-GMP-specific phosphodiesterase class I)/DNA-binding NarL/FixJ family response regulator
MNSRCVARAGPADGATGEGWPDISTSSVLVVDDHAANVALLERLVAKIGVGGIRGSTDARQALADCLHDPPDLLLLDMRMPHLDGVGFLEALRTGLPEDTFLPVLVLTADTTPEAKQAALAAGATDFLTKPFDATEVLLRVRNLLLSRALYARVQRHGRQLQAELDEQRSRQHERETERLARVQRIEEVLRDDGLSMVFQPMIDLATHSTVGVEALARFKQEPVRPPDLWFKEAADVGLSTALELRAVAAGLTSLDRLVDEQFLSLNVSPRTAQDPELRALLQNGTRGRIVLELTEHAAVADYEPLKEALDELRGEGVRIAVDDAGAGYASLQHILSLRPEIVKLDRTLTAAIHTDPARRALASALVSFGQEIGATIIAEGIEVPEELETLQRLGVRWGQGFYIGRPSAIETAVDEDPG